MSRPQARTVPTSAARPQPAQLNASHYNRLLAQRTAIGVTIVDQLSHGQDPHGELYDQANALDDALESDPRYDIDYAAIIIEAEALRFHTPGESLPANHDIVPCTLCGSDAAVHEHSGARATPQAA